MSALPELRPIAAPADARSGFLVAGSGSIGRRHVENLRRLGEKDASLYRTGHRDPRAPVVDAPADFDLGRALAARPLAVLVCNPSALHLEVALAAARAGAHILVEKPLAHAREGVQALADEVRRQGLVALVGFQYRFHPGLRRVKEWLEDGALGPVVSARVRWGEDVTTWHPGEDWRRSYAARRDLGGGAVRTLCHPFDYLRWLLGDVESVSAATSSDALRLDVEDLAHVVLRFASGSLATVTLDYLQRPRAHGLEIVGTRGWISWSDDDGAARLHDTARGRQALFHPPPAFSRNSMFLDEMRHFLACLGGRETPQCSLEEGRAALEIALAALRAAEEGRRVTIGAAA
ncbi:MAG TPA: Gfo/Idh/MocA family oxidoreductase [Vicinamibacteria bacterium]|nr:Gfo/Idh/MocA family oxidoreductase [Vicinamibacteria bacterium]